MSLFAESCNFVANLDPFFRRKIAVAMGAGRYRLRKYEADPVAPKRFGEIRCIANLVAIALVDHDRESRRYLAARQQRDRELNPAETSFASLCVVNLLCRTGKAYAHCRGGMPVDRRHYPPHMPSVRHELVLKATLGERIDQLVPFGVNCWLAAGEAAHDVPEQVCRFIHDPRNCGKWNRSHLRNIVTDAVRTAEIAVPC